MYMNVRGLKLQSDRCKVDQIKDLLAIENGMGISLTVTWLHPGILDAEIDVSDYTLFRGDRDSRLRGGVALYMRVNLLRNLLLQQASCITNLARSQKTLNQIYSQTRCASLLCIVNGFNFSNLLHFDITYMMSTEVG